MKKYIALILVAILSNYHVTLGISANKNTVTSEFDENIENFGDFQKELRNMRTKSAQLGDRNIMKEVFSPKRNSNLEETDPHLLESLGRDERNAEKNTYFSAFEPDFTKAGSIQYKRDAKQIANRTEKTLKGLTKLLRDSGIECIEEDKNSEIIDPNFIDEKEAQNKEVDFIEHFCEQPKRTYHCNDSMSISCEIRGWTEHPWQEQKREILFTADDILSKRWHYAVFWKKKRNGIHMRGGSGIREEIARRLSIHPGHIHEELDISARGNGEPYLEVAPQYFAWATYTVRYRYRDGHEICKKWSEERWDESCSLSSR